MPLGLRLPSGVRGDWGLESVPDDVDERSLATAVSSQPLSVSPEMERMEWYVKDRKEHDLRNLIPRPGPSFSGSGKVCSACWAERYTFIAETSRGLRHTPASLSEEGTG